MLAWLVAIGASEIASEEGLVLPDLDPDALSALLASDPMWTKPHMAEGYNNWRQVLDAAAATCCCSTKCILA